MQIPGEIKEVMLFSKPWKGIVYGLVCLIFLILFGFIGLEEPFVPMIAVGACFALLFIALTFYDLRFGFYGMIGFGFLLAFLDRMTHSSLPMYSFFFLLPFALFMVVTVETIFQRRRFKVERHLLLIAYLVMFAYGIFEVFNPQMGSFLGWVSYFRQSLSLLILLFVCLYFFKDLKSVRFFFQFMIGAIFITAVYGCIQQWFGLAPWDRQWVYGNPDVLGLYSLYGLGIRKFSFLTDPANYGSLLAAGAIATLIFALESEKKTKKIVLFFFTAVILLGMSYSGTRTANIMVVAGLALYIMITLYRKRTWVFTLMAGFVFLFILYAPIYGNVTLFRIRTAFRSPTNDASLNVRFINRERMRPYIQSHPFGGGVNTTGAGGAQYNPNHFLASIPPDSSLVANMMETGWVGLALHLIFLFLLLAYAIHYYYTCQNREIKSYYIIMATMLFSLGLVGAYAQYTLINVPQIFVYIPFIAIIIKLHTFDMPELSKKQTINK